VNIETVVAVLEKRGRFWAAEPQFTTRRSDASTPRLGGSRGIVLGAGALTDAQGRTARAGDLVLIEIPAARGSGRGRGNAGARGGGRGGGARARIERIIGRPDVARDAIEALMLDRGLARGFDPAVEREARAAHTQPPGFATPGSATRGRRDLRSLPTFTIDPAGARDFDDAISAELIDEGVRVWVHIADVSAYVREGSLVDREAKRRATSVYVPGAVEPMLPEALSNDACSLVPGAERLAVTVELELRHDGEVTRTAFYRSLIRSEQRLNYERVDRIFAGRESAAEPWGKPLEAARAGAAALEARRRKHGSALTLETSEPEFEFDADGHVRMRTGADLSTQTESHRLIEHLMIAANEAVARLLAERGVPCLYRVHERPNAERVARLIDQLLTLGVSTPPVPERMSSTQAAELLGEISRRVERHAQTLAARARAAEQGVGSSGGRRALTSLVLRSLQQAVYSPKNIGHAGLGSACYCHFTSPIRRYPDLVCHRALLSAIGGGANAPRASELQELATWTSERERDATIIERDADDMACCFALERVLYEGGWEQTFAGEVLGLISAGAFVAFGGAHTGTDAPTRPYEGMLPVRRMRSGGESEEREWWELNEQSTILRGEHTGATLALGEEIEVRVARVDTIRGRVDLRPAP
jgi:ribonuclease R